MPTVVVSSIGTSGRDYSTLQAWEDACPANLVTADQVWKGECYNDSEFTTGVVIGGQTTDSTRYVWLTVAAGHSFADSRENALFYAQTNGVAVTQTLEYLATVNASDSAYAVIERLQIKGAVSYGSFGVNLYSNKTFRNNLVVVVNDAWAVDANNSSASTKIINCVLIKAHAGTVLAPASRGNFINCTVVRPSTYTAGGTAFIRDYGLAVKNCAVFGFTTFRSGTGASLYTGSYNASDCAADAQDTNSTGGLTFSACFESTTGDFRLKAGSPLIGVGNTDATNAPNDITGTARGVGTAGDIGAWEYTAGGGGGTDMPEHLLRMRRPGVTWSNNTGA